VASSSKEPHTFPYVAPGPNWYPTPILPITIMGPNQQPLSTYGVVDSGADSSALPVFLASALGIDLDTDCHEDDDGISSGGGGVTQYTYPGGLAAEAAGTAFTMAAVFMGTPFILLGQEDFFQTFHVVFDRREQTFTIRPH
jgi:hypothetical protein